ncbi:hypothetical protein SBRCBS47491_009830 [Sporothrix bragantina]|uniref:Alpha beta-hydrolase n=1 Tax=Sporothrix bragantina TaxID=671064 RepID=A0ABP0CXY4_9PEZI
MAAVSTSARRRQPAVSPDAAKGDIRPRLGASVLSDQSRKPPTRTHSASSSSSTSFFGSQLGGQSVINYSYTDLPWKLLAFDVYNFFRLAWALPYIVWPVTPADSGALAELAPTWANLWCITVHAVLIVLQLVFLVGIVPAACLLPVWVAAGIVALCLGVNHVLCALLLNGGLSALFHGSTTCKSNPECAAARPEHAHEQWVFLNGVAVGRHWMQSNLDRLALTFGRPVLGIHNTTSGILFDVIECLVQRNYTYATRDVRVCYAILKKTLYRPDISRVVFVLHSQGGIEGGLVLDWLLQELPQDLLAKLEVYTFGNAANHWNNPHRSVEAQHRAAEVHHTAPQIVAESAVTAAAPHTASTSATLTSTGQAIGHIEHYAHTSDFVALWGVLHFVSSVPKTHTMPRFLGRVFARSSPRGGHQFCQHYLDGMFPLARDPQTGRLLKKCAETGNEFMESEIAMARDGDEDVVVHEAFERSWAAALNGNNSTEDAMAVAGSRTAGAPALVEMHASSPVLARQASQPRPVKVKDVSRLWQYRNGRSPDDNMARLGRLATM